MPRGAPHQMTWDRAPERLGHYGYVAYAIDFRDVAAHCSLYRGWLVKVSRKWCRSFAPPADSGVARESRETPAVRVV